MTSAPLRCRGEQWYLLRARLNGTPADERPNGVALQARFFRDDSPASEQAIELQPLSAARGDEWLGWVQSPLEANQIQVRLGDGVPSGLFSNLELHPVAERDPKCHPLAIAPRWDAYRPPFRIERVLAPAELADLAQHLPGGPRLETLPPPKSFAKLAAAARGAALLLPPQWVDALRLSYREIAHLAAEAWVIVDLPTYALLVGRGMELIAQREAHDVMSARVVYSDVPTRGFNLLDAFPFGEVCPDGRFSTRALASNRFWKRYAGDQGAAVLLASETPDPQRSNQILCAAQPFARGELLATDVPWLAALPDAALIAPKLTRHLLRMALGAPLPDYVQFWNRWDEPAVVVRDIADLCKRCPELRPVRWAGDDARVAHLGLSLTPPGGPATGHLILNTGRIDQRDAHDGVAPEAMMHWLKWLAREAREQTAWYRRHVGARTVTWQFDTTAGLQYATHYLAARGLPLEAAAWVRIRLARAGRDAAGVRRLAPPAGILGEGSLEFQAKLHAVIEQELKTR